jgi:hypothetical protein
MEIKRDGRTNPGAERAPRERDRLRVRPRGGLFDIVKRERGWLLPRVAFGRGRSHISGAAHGGTGARQPRMYRRQAAWSGTGSDEITVSLQVFSRSHGRVESLHVFAIMLRPERRRWPTRRATKKDGRRVTRRRNRARPTVSRLVLPA